MHHSSRRANSTSHADQTALQLDQTGYTAVYVKPMLVFQSKKISI